MVNKHKHNSLLATDLYVIHVNIDGERDND
ncbi:uncharacterized protein METZ01_LOCUS457434 [marine metagenome]|uniref:Uncharacterized protein n=1 Tax=marine metagenome TaxID=408172 RepID=A0A383AAG5_9ZZZZ